MPHPTIDQIVEDYTNTLFAQHAAEHDENKDAVPHGPLFLMPVCWVALHDYSCVDADAYRETCFIKNHSVNMANELPDSGYHLYAFGTDINSFDAMQSLNNIAGEGIYIRQDNGRYKHLDDELQTELGLDLAYNIDRQTPDTFKLYISNFEQRYEQWSPSPQPL